MIYTVFIQCLTFKLGLKHEVVDLQDSVFVDRSNRFKSDEKDCKRRKQIDWTRRYVEIKRN